MFIKILILFLIINLSKSCLLLNDLYVSTNGKYWYNNTGWNNINAECCDLYGVICYENIVIYIDLRGNNLTGTLPSKMWKNLPYLEYLLLGEDNSSIKNNNIYGSIPEEIYTMTELLYLSLSNNKIKDTISPKIGNLINLEYLLYYNMELYETIPNEICNLIHLNTLWIDNNHLNGEIPNCIGNLNSMVQFCASNNNLTGILPESMSKLNNLEILVLNRNKLTGNISPINNLTQIMGINLSDNLFFGEFLYNVSYPYLKSIDISNNLISSILLPDMPMLRYLEVMNNQLINIEWERFIHMDISFVDLSHNMLKTYPNHIFHYSISYLDISNNPINGVVEYQDTCNSISENRKNYIQTLDISNTNIQIIRKEMCIFNFLAYLFMSNTIVPDYAMKIMAIFRGLKLLDISNTNASGDLQYLSSKLSYLDILNIENTAIKTNMNTILMSNSSIHPVDDYTYYGEYSCIKMRTESGAIIKSDSDFVNYENCACNANYYGKPPNCIPCDNNANCIGSLTEDPYLFYKTSGRIYPNLGYWISPCPTIDQMDNGLYPNEILKCPISKLCEVSNGKTIDNVDFCIIGHKGRFCTECDSNYYSHSNFICSKCPNIYIVIIYIIIFSMIVISLIIIAFTMGSTNSGYLKIFTFFVQVTGKVYYSSSSGATIANSLLNYLNEFNILGMKCITTWNFEHKYIFKICLPFAIFLTIIIVFNIGKYIFKLKDRWTIRCMRALIFLLYFLYMPVSVDVLTPLSCNSGYISSIPYIKCDNKYIAPSIIMLILYTISLPILAFYSVFKKYQQESLILITGCYTGKAKYWEIIITLRRLLFVIIMQTTSVNSNLQYVLFITLISSTLLIHGIYKPFKTDLENNMEFISLVFIIITGAYSTKAKDNDTGDNNSYKSIGVLILTFNFIISIILLTFALNKIIKNKKKNKETIYANELKEVLIG